jgi:phosphatidylinositol glycan class T
MSQSHGELSVSVTNHMDIDTNIAYLETMPWLLQFYLHTLTTTIEGVTRSQHFNLFYP